MLDSPPTPSPLTYTDVNWLKTLLSSRNGLPKLSPLNFFFFFREGFDTMEELVYDILYCNFVSQTETNMNKCLPFPMKE